MHLALIGSDGLPARYGGFETFVEQITPELVALGHEVTIIGSSVGRSAPPPFLTGVQIQNLPIRANGASSILFDIVSFLIVFRKVDAILLLGVSAGLFVPMFRLLLGDRRIAVNVDGLEARRAKWTGLRGRFLAISERMAVKGAHYVVADNAAIATIVTRSYGRASTTIAYGADHVKLLPPDEVLTLLSSQLQISPQAYALTVARIEPENHIGLMIDAMLRQPRSDEFCYVVVGNFEATAYGRELRMRYAGKPRVQLLDPIYDPQLLAALRASCAVYLHGHSVGGTNPSLIEMLPYERPILAFDCPFNRATLRDSGGYFESIDTLCERLASANLRQFVPAPAVRNDPAYRWREIASSYTRLLSSQPC